MHPRRLLGILAVFALGGCRGAATGIDFNLVLDDPVRAVAASARIIVSRDDGGSFPAAAANELQPGLTVKNVDVGGIIDVVVEFTRRYPLVAGDNKFKLVPTSLPGPINVRLRAEVFDAYDNVVARLNDAQMRDWVPAVLQPGTVTGQSGGGIVLHPVCQGTCSAATVYPSAQIVPEAVGGPISAIATGNLTGSTQPRSDLIVGSETADHGAAPAAGHVRVYLGPQIPYPQRSTKDIYGAAPGDGLGSALAVGDLDGDGKDDLVIGARGAALGDGALFVVLGTSAWWMDSTTPLDLSGAAVKRFAAAGNGEHLGAALALLDVDGDGKPEIIAGAPDAGGGAGAVYVVRLADLMGGSPDGGAPSAAVAGRPGAQLGRSLAAYRGMLAAGAPLEAKADGTVGGAVYLLAARDLASHHDAASLGRWLGEGGGFASSVALAALDGKSLSLIAGAPGAGSVLMLSGLSSLTGDMVGATRALHGASPVGSLGAALARAPLGSADALIIGAPAVLQSGAPAADAGVTVDGGAAGDMGVPVVGHDPSAGAIFVFRGDTLLIGNLNVGADGHPAALAAYGDSLGGGYGSHLVVGDFNADGVLDIAVAAATRRALYLLLGTL